MADMADDSRIKRLDGETEQAWAAFLAYAKLGPGRTYPRALEALGMARSSTSQLKKYAKRHNWRARVSQWDQLEIAEERASRIKSRDKAAKKFHDAAPAAADRIIKLGQGLHAPGAKPSVQLQADIHILAQAGMVPPKRTELIVDQSDGLDQAREAISAMSLAQLEAILALPDDPAEP